MKLRFFVLLSIMVLGSYGLADAQMISLDHADGLIDADHLDTGVPVTFYIRVQGDADTHGGITNGFRIFSEDGATWNPTVGDTIGIGKTQFDGGFFITEAGVTGSLADTLGFGGFRFFGAGLPAGYDDIAYTIDIGPIPESSIGKTICLDSTFYPPTGLWKWDPEVFPDWDGPHCYIVGLLADPEIVSVAPNTAVQCDEGLVVTITGANTDWQSGAEVSLTHNSGSPTITATSVVVNGATEVQATFSIAYDAPTGLYDVSVGSDILEDGFTVTAAPASNIVVSPLELNFDADACAPDLGPKSFNVSSEGCAYDFSISANVGWLDLPVLDGTTPMDLETSVNSSIPGPGTYNATITITAPGALNSPQEITVTLVVPETPAPGGLEMNARILAMSTSGWQDDQTVFGTGNAATDCYDAGTDAFEPPPPPGNFVRAYFNHPEWEQVSNEFNSDIRSTFSTLCKDYVLTVETNLTENVTLSIPAIVNPGCYKISLLSTDGSAVLVDNFEADSHTFMASATQDFIIRVCAGGGGVAPSITCQVGDYDVTICGSGQVCVDLPVDNATSVTSTGNATWTNGQLCFTATASGRFVFDVTASNSCGDDVCRVSVEVGIGSAPVIDCPQGEGTDGVPVERCGPGEICVPFAITGADSVSIDGATWADGQLCFNAEASGPVSFFIEAFNDCGTEVCNIEFDVTLNDAPVIACPDTIHVTQDAGEPLCFELVTTGADNITLDAGDWNVSYTNNQFCYDASTLGTFVATITATNGCGETTCEVTVVVEDCPLPVVECPAEPLNVEQCVLESIQIPMAISGQNDLWVSEPSSWAEGILTIVPNGFNNLHVLVRAGNDCGITECEVIVNFTELPMPVITCPDEEFQYILCAPEEEICIDLPIANADEVVVIWGDATWADGQLCFIAGDNRDSINVVATNACGADTCSVKFLINYYDEPVADFTADPNEGAVPLEVTFTNNSFVDTESEEYLWDFGDGASSTATSPMHIFETIGCFDVTLTVTDDCGRTATAMQTICVLDDQIVIPTDTWIAIACENPTLEGNPLQPGDYITAFDPDGILCGMGQVEPDGGFLWINIYADDQTTPDIDEGADPGDLITLKINGVPVATDPALFWTENGDTYVLCEFTAEQCLSFELEAGWNLISWNVAYSGAVDEAIADFNECVDVVLGFDRGGLTHDPALPQFSTLNNLDYYHGYWVRLSCPVSFEICGGIISPNDAIQVYSGWNLVGYWPEDVMPVEEGFASLLETNNLLVAYGFDDGAADYIPGDPLHQSLTDLAPGFGYWVKVISDDILAYPGFSGGTIAAPRADNQNSLAASVGVSPSRDWMSIYGANLTVDGFSVRSGAPVEVYTEDGVLCGSGVYSDGILKFTSVYGFDSENDSYPQVGDQLNVRIDGERVDSDLTYSGAGARVSLGSLSAAALLPDAYSMAQNYPNPFNPSTTISFTLPTAGSVQLAIYNVLGQTVATIVNGRLEAGTHEVVWNGSDNSGSAVGSGIYFYRITTSDFDQTKKMIMMK